jgi:hypothetical protein
MNAGGMCATESSLMLRLMLGSLRGRCKSIGAEDAMKETAYIRRSAVCVSESLKVLLVDIRIGHPSLVIQQTFNRLLVIVTDGTEVCWIHITRV